MSINLLFFFFPCYCHPCCACKVFGDLPESVVVNAEDIAMLSLLGRGGFGAVFSGTLGRNVAFHHTSINAH